MSPRSAAQNDALRADARDRIERAALRVFARSGYAGSSVRDVAREAGVAQGLLYNYYAGKSELLAAIMRRAMADVAESFAAAQINASPAEQLAHLIHAAFRLVPEHLEFWQLLYGVRQQPDVLGVLSVELFEFTAQVRATLEAHLVALNDPMPAVRARLLFATIDGVAQHYAMESDRYPLTAVAHEVVTLFTGLTQPLKIVE